MALDKKILTSDLTTNDLGNPSVMESDTAARAISKTYLFNRYIYENPNQQILSIDAKESISSALGHVNLMSGPFYDANDEAVRKDAVVNTCLRGIVVNVLQRDVTFQANWAHPWATDESKEERVEEIKTFCRREFERRLHTDLSPWLLCGLIQGWSPLEIVYRDNGNGFLGIDRLKHIHPGLFSLNERGQMFFYDQIFRNWSGRQDQPVPPFKFAKFINPAMYSNPYGESMIGWVEWLYEIKKQVLVSMAEMCDKFGAPFVHAQIKGATPDTESFKVRKNNLKAQLERLTATNGIITTDQDILSVVSRAAGQGVSLHRDALDYLDRQIVLVLRGAVLGILESEHDSRAASETHAKENDIRTKPLARITEETFSRGVLNPFLFVNFGREAMDLIRLDIDTDDPANIDDTIKTVESAVKVVEVSKRQVRDWYGLEEPVEPDDIIPIQQQAAPAMPALGASGLPFEDGNLEMTAEDAANERFITTAEAAAIRGGSTGALTSWIKNMSAQYPNLAPRRFRGRIHKGDFDALLSSVSGQSRTNGIHGGFDGPEVYDMAEGTGIVRDASLSKSMRIERAAAKRLDAFALESKPALAEAITKAVGTSIAKAKKNPTINVDVPKDVRDSIAASVLLSIFAAATQYKPDENFAEWFADTSRLDPRFADAVNWIESRQLMSKAELDSLIASLANSLEPLGLSATDIERLIRDRVLALKGAVDTAATSIVREQIASKIATGKTTAQAVKDLRDAMEKQGFPGLKDDYAETVMRTETSNAYNAQRREIDQTPTIQSVLLGRRILNPSDARSRESHAALNNMVVANGSEADQLLGYPPFSYNCRCVSVPVVKTRPDQQLSETPDALDRVRSLQRFHEGKAQ